MTALRDACLCLLLVLWASMTRAEVYAVEGLTLGMSRLAVEQRLPGLRIDPVPYEDERLGFDYRVVFGRIAILRYEGEIVRFDGAGRAAEIRLTFTGADRLFDIRATRLDPRRGCAGHLRELMARWGRPLIDEGPGYALWRTTVVLGPRLAFQCLDDARGLYELRLDQETMQRRYIEKLSEDLVPALRAATQFLLGR